MFHDKTKCDTSPENEEFFVKFACQIKCTQHHQEGFGEYICQTCNKEWIVYDSDPIPSEWSE